MFVFFDGTLQISSFFLVPYRGDSGETSANSYSNQKRHCANFPTSPWLFVCGINGIYSIASPSKPSGGYLTDFSMASHHD